jgi:hypothetical protein
MQKIIRGADFSDIIQIVTQPYSEGLRIKSTTAANPAIIETDLPHKLTTSDKVYLWGHRPNTIVNGNNVATVVDAFRFSVPVTGVIAGGESGYVGKTINATGFSVTLKMKDLAGGTEFTDAAPTLTWIDQTIHRFKVSLTDTKTALLLTDRVVLYVKYTDTLGFDRIFTKEYEVKSA